MGGKIDLAGTDGNQDGHNLTITAGSGDVTLTDVAAHSSEEIDIEGATVTVGVIGASDEIKKVTLDGSTKVVLGGNITTSNISGNNIPIKGPAETAAATNACPAPTHRWTIDRMSLAPRALVA